MEFVDWGEVPYPEATDRQLKIVEQVASGNTPDTIIFCTHPPVVTLGRSTHKNDVLDWKGEVYETSRGGRATYHGPDQLVVYPIIDLKRDREKLRSKDVHHYLRILEQVIVSSLETLDIPAEIRETKSTDPEGKELIFTGVWSGEKKIASIGIAVRKWVTYHGVALNLFSSEAAFSGIQPCGFTTGTMTSLEELTAKKPSREDVIQKLKQSFLQDF